MFSVFDASRKRSIFGQDIQAGGSLRVRVGRLIL